MARGLKSQTGAVTVDEVDQRLPKTFFVKRGAIAAAFGLTRKELEGMIPEVFVPSEYRGFKRKRFLRDQVIAVARKWAANSAPNT